MDIEFTGYQPTCSDMPGETFHFCFEGNDYFAERWAATYSGGLDIYRADTGAAVDPFDDEQRDEFEELLWRFTDAIAQRESALGIPELTERALGQAINQINTDTSLGGNNK